MTNSIVVGHRITIEPIYEHAFCYGENPSSYIDQAMPRLNHVVSDLSEGIKAVNEYFAAIPHQM